MRNPVTPSLVRSRTGYAVSLAGAETQKNSKYVTWLQTQNNPGSFYPLVVPMFGGFGVSFRKLLNLVSEDVVLSANHAFSYVATSWLTFARNMLAVTLIKENA